MISKPKSVKLWFNKKGTKLRREKPKELHCWKRRMPMGRAETKGKLTGIKLWVVRQCGKGEEVVSQMEGRYI